MTHTTTTGADREYGNRHAHLALSSKQFLSSLCVGAVLWFIAAMMLQVMGPMGVYDGTARVLMYVLIIPGTVPFLMLGYRIAGLRADQRFVGVSVMLMAAMLLDGVALAWFSGLYGDSAERVAGAGGTILWGAGVAAVLAYIMNKPRD